MTIFETLDEIGTSKDLLFLVIGGHAVNAYGFSRFTKDLDILINAKQRSEWVAALEQRGFKIEYDGRTFLQMTSPPESAWPLDLMLVNEETFKRLNSETKIFEMAGTQMRVPSLWSLFALKFHVLKQEVPGRGFKDLLDVLELAKCNAVDVRSDKMRELCEQFGNKKIYERLIAFGE